MLLSDDRSPTIADETTQGTLLDVSLLQVNKDHMQMCPSL